MGKQCTHSYLDLFPIFYHNSVMTDNDPRGTAIQTKKERRDKQPKVY